MAARSGLYNAVGLAMKAGRLRSGDFATERLVRAGKARLALIDEDASDNTCGKYTQICEAAHIGLVRVPALGACIGKPGRMLAAVTDKNFADMILAAALNDGTDHSNDRG